MTIQVEAYLAVEEWRTLWRIISWRDGLPFDKVNTHQHIRAGVTPPRGHVAASFSTSVTCDGGMLTIDEYTG